MRTRMMNTRATKRSRATAKQQNQLVDFMLQNPGLASKKFLRLHGKVEYDRKWIELTALLNSLGGAVKTVEQWHTVWRDLKSRTNIKVRHRKRQQALTGNKRISEEPITDLEKRVVSLIGCDYIGGYEDVKQNVSMDEEFQLLLEEEDLTFNTPSSSITPVQLRLDTLKKDETPGMATKRKCCEETEKELKFLDIANNALKVLADSTTMNAETNKLLAEAMKTMGEGLKLAANAVNNLANALTEKFEN